MLRRRIRPLAFWALAGVSLLVAHDAVIFVQVGPGAELSRALRSGGHDYWGVASGLLLLAGLLGALVSGIRIRRLRHAAGRLNATPRLRGRRLAARIPGMWLRLFTVVAIGFTVQENVEHLVDHSHLIGTGALLGPEYPLALPILGLITLLAAVGAALVVSVERELVSAIATALAGIRRRAPRSLRRPPTDDAPSRLPVLARRGAGRAPPVSLVTLG